MTTAKEYWTLPECLSWMATRSTEFVQETSDIPAADAFRRVMMGHSPGLRYEVRIGRSRERYRVRPHNRAPFAITSERLLPELRERALAGRICVRAVRKTSGLLETVFANQFSDLNIMPKISEDGVETGLVSRSSGKILWYEPVFRVADVQKCWPAAQEPPPTKTQLVERRIYDRLTELTKDGLIARDRAHQECRNVEGFYPEAFKRAWKSFPKDKKLGRGQHGPRRTAGLKRSDLKHPKT